MMRINEAFPSRFIKAGDLADGVLRARIKKVAWEMVGTDERPVMTFVGQSKSMPLNKTNFRTIADAYGDESDDWTGKEIDVYSTRVSDPTGRLVDGLRVRVPAMRKPDASVNVAPNPEPTPPASAYEDLDDLIPDEDPFAHEVRG
jgi:hypothetical protein